MVPRQSLSAYRDALAQSNATRYGGNGGGGISYSAPSVTRTSTAANSFSAPQGGYVLTSSAFRGPDGKISATGVEKTFSAPPVSQTSTVNNAFAPPTGARLTDGQGNSLTAASPQNAYAQALAGGGALENPFAQNYSYLQSLMNGSAYDVDSLRYTEPTGGYADTVQENANKIVAPVYNPTPAAQWNYDVPETVRMQSGGQLSPAADAYSGMVDTVTSDADIAMAQYWADIANTAQSEIDRQYALRQALRYRNRIV